MLTVWRYIAAGRIESKRKSRIRSGGDGRSSARPPAPTKSGFVATDVGHDCGLRGAMVEFAMP